MSCFSLHALPVSNDFDFPHDLIITVSKLLYILSCHYCRHTRSLKINSVNFQRLPRLRLMKIYWWERVTTVVNLRTSVIKDRYHRTNIERWQRIHLCHNMVRSRRNNLLSCSTLRWLFAILVSHCSFEEYVSWPLQIPIYGERFELDNSTEHRVLTGLKLLDRGSDIHTSRDCVFFNL